MTSKNHRFEGDTDNKRATGQGSQGGWKKSLARVLQENNGIKADGTICSHATQDKRSDVLFSGFQLLRTLGYKLDDVHQFKGKHMNALAKEWIRLEMSSSTIQNNISIFRRFASWIGKEGMVEASDKYAPQGQARRTSINMQDKSWAAAGIDVKAKLQEVAGIDPRIALQLELQERFGLRAQESWLFKPHIADNLGYVQLTKGTKGGKDRTCPIDTPEKRDLIERCKAMVGSKTESMADPKLSLAQVKNRYYWVVRKAGIKREEGITSHGLRHEYANDRYEHFAGQPSPVRGGGSVASDDDQAARLKVAQELGHARTSITTHYLGR